MSGRAQARAEMADPEIQALQGAAPGLALVAAGLATVALSLGAVLLLAWRDGNHALLAGVLAGIVLGARILLRAVGLPTLLLLALSLLVLAEAAVARLLLPDPRPGTTAHDRLRRHAAMTQARRRLRRLGLGAGWIGGGAAVLDRRGRVRLLRRP